MLSRVKLKHINYIRIDICVFKLSENVKNMYFFGLRFLSWLINVFQEKAKIVPV